ncbi:hypothetical protein ACFVFS_23870 [Kitasatospora sp. NPDC057692]|uniref:hypothetical protein n=1 Tax=Kitasatospora sp. NPDC057692 TaxID=3346215 RepID=UPI00367C4404
MHTPQSPPSSSPGDDGASVEDARAAIGVVIAWYGRQMMTARRAGDQQRLAELAEQLRVCGEDRERLGDAGPGEIDRIIELYTERLRGLEDAGAS